MRFRTVGDATLHRVRRVVGIDGSRSVTAETAVARLTERGATRLTTGSGGWMEDRSRDT